MFTPVLMTYVGDDGAMRMVAEEIAGTLRDDGLETEVRALSRVSGLEGFRTVVLGAPFVAGRMSAEARAFLDARRDDLTKLPVAVFAMGPGIPDAAGVVCGREGLLEELAHLRWLHPIAAEMFCANGSPANGTHGALPDPEIVRQWARLVARVLHPAALR